MNGIKVWGFLRQLWLLQRFESHSAACGSEQWPTVTPRMLRGCASVEVRVGRGGDEECTPMRSLTMLVGSWSVLAEREYRGMS